MWETYEKNEKHDADSTSKKETYMIFSVEVELRSA